jgi:hypothetical protein
MQLVSKGGKWTHRRLNQQLRARTRAHAVVEVLPEVVEEVACSYSEHGAAGVEVVEVVVGVGYVASHVEQRC